MARRKKKSNKKSISVLGWLAFIIPFVMPLTNLIDRMKAGSQPMSTIFNAFLVDIIASFTGWSTSTNEWKAEHFMKGAGASLVLLGVKKVLSMLGANRSTPRGINF